MYLRILFLFLMSLAVLSVFGQNTRQFYDSMAIYPDLVGYTNYEYFIRDNQQIKDGKFTHFYNSQDTTDISYTNKILLNGRYKNNLKTDLWQFRSKRFKPTSIPIIDGYQVIHKSAGVEHIVNVSFVNGVATGNGLIETNLIEESELAKNLFKANATFKNNYFVGSFQAKNDSIKITGEVDENGLFSNVWIFEHVIENEPIIEKRYYQKGVLVRHEIERKGETSEIQHIGLSKNPDDEGEWLSLNANKDYFNIILRSNIGKKDKANNSELPDIIIERSNIFLKQSLLSFREFNDLSIWKVNDDDTHIYLPKLRVRKISFTDEEKILIAEATEQIEEAKSIINNFLKDPQVELNRHAYEELALYYEVYTEYIDEINELSNVFKYLNYPSMEFIDRSEFIPYVFKGVSFPKTVKFEFKDALIEKEINFPRDVASDEANVVSLAKYVGELFESLTSKLEIVNPIIERNKKRFEIKDKELQLLRLKDSVHYLFVNNALNDDFNKLHERFANVIITKADEVFNRYIKLPIEQRLQRTDSALICMENLVTTFERFIRIQTQLERTKENYSRTVWNPFTFTDMEETVKERIYLAYKNDLIPYLLNQLESNINCDNFVVKFDNFDKVYNRMLDLREQDTREQERLLRRVHDPEKIIEILEFNLTLN
jgi:hypothetical protein